MTQTLNSAEESQLLQTIEMFEVITQSQPNDYQSLEILKEAYSKLGREKEAILASKRIAQAYMDLGQLSLAILELELVLQRAPDDREAQAALARLENRANFGAAAPAEPEPAPKPAKSSAKAAAEVDDGRQMMYKLFVDSKTITAQEFEACWPKVDPVKPPGRIVDPLIQALAERNVVPIEKSLKLISDKVRLGYIPLEKYDCDAELVRSYTREICQRWCLVPFDRMGKSVMVATSNPFNKEAARQLEQVAAHRILWYLSPPADLIRTLGKIFR